MIFLAWFSKTLASKYRYKEYNKQIAPNLREKGKYNWSLIGKRLHQVSRSTFCKICLVFCGIWFLIQFDAMTGFNSIIST